jgi:hypothetical protein
MVLRECRRLKEGLPIYAYRRRILNLIVTNQVTMDDWNSLRDFVSRELQSSVNYLKAFGTADVLRTLEKCCVWGLAVVHSQNII